MSPKEFVQKRVEHFNAADALALSNMYAEEAINHQVSQDPVKGKKAILAMFKTEFAAADMKCMVEQIFEGGDWAILTWKDPLGLMGCGFFQIQ